MVRRNMLDKGVLPQLARYSSCFSHFNYGPKTKVIHHRSLTSFQQRSSPSYFILESPPRTRVLKWFPVLTDKISITGPGLFNIQIAYFTPWSFYKTFQIKFQIIYIFDFVYLNLQCSTSILNRFTKISIHNIYTFQTSNIFSFQFHNVLI